MKRLGLVTVHSFKAYLSECLDSLAERVEAIIAVAHNVEDATILQSVEAHPSVIDVIYYDGPWRHHTCLECLRDEFDVIAFPTPISKPFAIAARRAHGVPMGERRWRR